MRILLFVFTLILASCGDSLSNVEPIKQLEVSKPLSLTDLNQSSTWYELNQYYNGIPKYSGAFGTYTAKHTPIAIHHKGITYYTYSDNSDGTLRIYVSNESETVEVHQAILGDPHSNATISIDKDGYIWVHVSAKGTKEIGAIYKSIQPETLDFQLIDKTWQAYPQPWKTDHGQVILYTLYERPVKKKVRQLYIKTDTCNKLLVKDGHYQVSIYKQGKLHTFYNWHPEGNVDNRKNIYYLYSVNGCDWFNQYDELLDLPLEGNDSRTLVYDSNRNIYLKDIDINNNPLLLYVESDTHDPTQGERELYLLELGNEPELITPIGHNYATGFYQDGYIITPTWGGSGYASSDLELFTKSDTWKSISVVTGDYNYARKIHGIKGGFVSEEIGKTGKMIKIDY